MFRRPECSDDKKAKYPAAFRFRLSRKLRDSVNKAAQAESVPASELIRRAIAERVIRIETTPFIANSEEIAHLVNIGRSNPSAIAAVAEIKPHVIEHAKNAREWLGVWIDTLGHGVQPGCMSSHECFLHFEEQITAAADLAIMAGQAAALIISGDTASAPQPLSVPP